jgi:cell division protein ZipA
VAEFRWSLLAVGILVLIIVFWWSRRESRGERIFSGGLLRRDRPIPPLEPEQPVADDSPKDEPLPPRVERIVTVRLMARDHGAFPGEQLFRILRDAGLRHGRFGIFHFHQASDQGQEVFSVASLIEPGSFDLARMKESSYPGVSLFLILPSPGDAVSAFDQMLVTARDLAGKLGGDLLDEHGSKLSVQRERYLREEVIEYQHNTLPP